MSDKTTVLRAFNNVFFEFLGEVQKVLPDDADIKDAVAGLEFFKKANPTCIVKAWQFFVYEPYKEEIGRGDITFFCDKDYQSDLSYMANSDEIMKVIQRIRTPLRSMSEENKQVVVQFVTNLCRLSLVYSAL